MLNNQVKIMSTNSRPDQTLRTNTNNTTATRSASNSVSSMNSLNVNSLSQSYLLDASMQSIKSRNNDNNNSLINSSVNVNNQASSTPNPKSDLSIATAQPPQTVASAKNKLIFNLTRATQLVS
jgi:hypothetical protein